MIFGEESPAVKYLDKKIEKNGPDDEVIVEEGQLVSALMYIHNEGEKSVDEIFPEEK
jgi:hypothetical protein